MAGGGPQQNLFGRAYPVVAKDNPPEGRMVIPLGFALTPSNYSQITNANIADLKVSQIRTIYVDNTSNTQPLIVTHGVALDTANIPAGGGGFIPTTSSQGAYFLQVALASAPTSEVDVSVTLYNYEIPPSVFGNTIQETQVIQFVDTYVNPFHNAGCQVAQRGSGSSVAGAVTPIIDGLYIFQTGAALSWAPGGQIGNSDSSCVITGATGATGDAFIYRRLISADAIPLLGAEVIFQFKLQNNSQAPIVPTLALYAPTVKSNFGTVTQALAPVTMQTCSIGNTTLCAVAFVMPYACATGAEFRIDAGPLNLATSTVAVTDFDICIAPTVPTGLVSLPPRNRLKAFMQNIQDCQFFLDSTALALTGAFNRARMTCVGNDYVGGANVHAVGMKWHRTMFGVPTLQYFDGAGTASKFSYYQNGGPWTDGYTGTNVNITQEGSQWTFPTPVSAFFNYLASAEP